MEHPYTTPFKNLERFFEDPRMGEEFAQMMRGFQSQVDEGFVRAKAAANIGLALPSTMTGQEDVATSLQEHLAALDSDGLLQAIPSKSVIGFYGTWAEAEALILWDICDGRGNTPDLMSQYTKWVADDADAGDYGGSLQHTHTSHAEHFHDVGSPTTGPTGLDAVQRATDDAVNVGSQTHTHDVETPTAGWGPMAHSLANNEPPYVTLIPIMKK